jgi:hypothetical protein
MSAILKKIGVLLRFKQPDQAGMAKMTEMIEEMREPGQMMEMGEMELMPEPGQMMEMEQMTQMEQQEKQTNAMTAISSEMEMNKQQIDQHKDRR